MIEYLSCSACRVAPKTRAAALAPISAVGRVWAVCWVPLKQLTVWKRTTCSPPARQEGDPVDLREDIVPHQESAVTQVKSGLFALTVMLGQVCESRVWWIGTVCVKIIILSSPSESCAVDSDCLGEMEASDQADSSAGSSPAELLLRLLHVATRGQTEYWIRQEWRPSPFHFQPRDLNLETIKIKIHVKAQLFFLAAVVCHIEETIFIFSGKRGVKLCV